MSREARFRFSVNGGTIIDATDRWSFYIMPNTSTRLVPPLRNYETKSYPEEQGERVLPITKEEGFDHTFVLSCIGEDNKAAENILEFKNMVLVSQPDGTKRGVEIEAYDDYHRVKIVGLVQDISATKFHNNPDKYVWEFSIKMRVTDPSKCNFNL